jgi:hypothetical protein
MTLNLNYFFFIFGRGKFSFLSLSIDADLDKMLSLLDILLASLKFDRFATLNSSQLYIAGLKVKCEKERKKLNQINLQQNYKLLSEKQLATGHFVKT